MSLMRLSDVGVCSLLSTMSIDFWTDDGRMLQKEKSVSIKRIFNEPDVTIMLISLKAGGTGISVLSHMRGVIDINCLQQV